MSAVWGLKRKYEEHAKKRFKDLVIQDRTIIRLHESLAKIWPAARKRELIHAFTLGKCVYATSRLIIN